MTTFLKKLLASSLLVFAFACGGPVDSSDETSSDIKAPLNYEPFDGYADALARAARYGKNPAAVGLVGVRTADTTGFEWQWTFQCDDRMYVEIATAPGYVRVKSHSKRAYLLPMGTFDPAKLAVSGIDLAQILNKAGYPTMLNASLDAPVTSKMQPRWLAQVRRPSGNMAAQTTSIVVDAMSGSIVQ